MAARARRHARRASARAMGMACGILALLLLITGLLLFGVAAAAVLDLLLQDPLVTLRAA